ncbi:Maf family protein [Marinospirillum sp.]|uniref:Maf family protein n=1 Tax=Marinospirillum sp. TaxID=2183934 RepID=UPI00287051DA|nr:Maf family protein [Marinospirillum sp.]MDR9468764.1 Maf family protein [Marinospirillum sp.]
MPDLVLASSSPYRQQLLQKLQLPFTSASPDIDETPLGHESAPQLVERLACLKAQALAHRFPQALIIGSDQVCCHQGLILGKPGNREQAIQQLSQLQGQSVSFYTGLCLYNATSQQSQSLVDEFKVHFRALSPDQIRFYVDAEQPFDCAGSFKSEGLGITLFQRLEGDDPNSLIGLPLIRLTELLRQAGVEVLRASA